MEKRLKVAAIMLYVFAAYLILFGLVYLLSPRIMPYHERFLGKTFEELDPKTAYAQLGHHEGGGLPCVIHGYRFCHDDQVSIQQRGQVCLVDHPSDVAFGTCSDYRYLIFHRGGAFTRMEHRDQHSGDVCCNGYFKGCF